MTKGNTITTFRIILKNWLGSLAKKLNFEIQQHFIESDKDGTPFPGEVRSLVYKKSKGVRETVAFGAQNNIIDIRYQFSYPSLPPKKVPNEREDEN